MSKFIVEAIKAEAVAKEAKAIANLENYLSNAVGVGEHPDIVSECVKLVKEAAEAKEILATCERLFKEKQDGNTNTEA